MKSVRHEYKSNQLWIKISDWNMLSLFLITFLQFRVPDAWMFISLVALGLI